MDVAAHRASLDEVAVTATLVREGREEITDTRGAAEWLRREAQPEPLEAAHAAMIADTECTIIVGTLDGVPLGVMAVAQSEAAGGTAADITELYVTPQARSVGVGEAMMELALQWARDNDLIGIGGRSLPGDRQTKGLFERYGLVARSIEVYRAGVGSPDEDGHP